MGCLSCFTNILVDILYVLLHFSNETVLFSMNILKNSCTFSNSFSRFNFLLMILNEVTLYFLKFDQSGGVNLLSFSCEAHLIVINRAIKSHVIFYELITWEHANQLHWCLIDVITRRLLPQTFQNSLVCDKFTLVLN